MLERIVEIQGIGLLHDASGKQHTCRKATLIYGDNGRGKSTLASILRSLSTGNASLITHRKTLDGKLPPKVALHFGSGHQVNFKTGAWSERRSEILVFDADFIERNVHSGGAVNTNHRKNLLEFALGEAAVAARAAVEKATTEAKKASEEVQLLSAQLLVFHSGMTLVQFEKLTVVTDADKQLVALQTQIRAAANIKTITAKAVPATVAEPLFDIAGVFSVLSFTLKDVHNDAEQVVKQHLEKLNSNAAEGWLSQGLQFGDDQNCPYCNQVTTGNDLIKAYQTHFNVAYADLKNKVTTLQTLIARGTAKTIVDSIQQAIAIAAAQAAAWSEQVQSNPFAFDPLPSANALQELRELLLDLARQKQASPADAAGSPADLAKAEQLCSDILLPLRITNNGIKAAADLIVIYKGKLANANIAMLQQEVSHIEATKRRQQQNVVGLLAKLATASKAAEAAEKVKKAQRDNLDTLMTVTLGKYEQSINVLLKNFGASFSIEGMGANFRGNAPRSEYGLQLRGKTIALEGSDPSFATALSEGDKRTLAFAFFVASTMADAKLATKTLVVDDPMCSLDANRRQHTKAILKRLHAGAAQLIVLAHDPYFLRDFRDALFKTDPSAPISLFQLGPAANNYTSFGAFDIDRECESSYFQHHRSLNDFCSGVSGDARAVAKAVRPMLEGYLHRRFPGLVPKALLFGQVVLHIKDAISPSPLVHAQGLVVELNEINDYAGQFHHDTNPGGADTVAVVSSELKTFVTRALHVVHKGEAHA